MSHIETVKKLFGDFKFLFQKQSNIHTDLERVNTELIKFNVTHPLVMDANSELKSLKGKSAIFYREFEKLRNELNEFKNDENSEPEVSQALSKKLSFIEEKQAGLEGKLASLKSDVFKIKTAVSEVKLERPNVSQPAAPIARPQPTAQKVVQPRVENIQSNINPKKPEVSIDEVQPESAEEFIGQKVFSWVGIGILLIGLGLGVKYAVENDMLGPGMRIVLGYIAGLALVGTGLALMKKYESFAAVLVGGGIAATYFVTYAAHQYGGYLSQIPAFGIMLGLTAFTVWLALKYKSELIAIIGLVGAYGIPFLLNDGSGKVEILFTYMAIINVGILVLASKKNWKAMYYSAFGLTWLIFAGWFITQYNVYDHFAISLIFGAIFFVTFYATFLVHKLIKNEEFNEGDIVLTLVNTLIFFTIGFWTMHHHPEAKHYAGVFCLVNAAFHGIVTAIFYKRNWIDKGMFYLEAGMVLLFLTIAIPIQFEGNWIPMFFTIEGLLLFAIGRLKGIKVFEILSFPVIIIAFFSVARSLFVDYEPFFENRNGIALSFVTNKLFLSSMLALAGFVIITFINRYKPKRPEVLNGWQSSMDYFLPIMTIALGFFAMYTEIWTHWSQEIAGSVIETGKDNWDWSNMFGSNENPNLKFFRNVFMSAYTLVFVSVLGLCNWQFWKSKNFGNILIGVTLFVMLIFVIINVTAFTELGENLTSPSKSAAQHGLDAGRVYLYKYISLAIFALCAVIQWLSAKSLDLGDAFKHWNSAILHLFALILISHEFLFLLDVNGHDSSTKLSLSILWAVYAVFLMGIGIVKKQGYLRISAFAILGIIILKLLLWDLAHMSMGVKTIAFMSIGALMLIVSFLYYQNRGKFGNKNGGE